MLTQLRIKNFAIIESVALPLHAGLNVLSGETGAGKSIVIGALGLLIGERASVDDVRTGADKAIVEGEFAIGDAPDIARALDAHGLDAGDGVLVLKREVAAAGRTRAWINGSPVTASVLAEIGRLLVTVHGQHDARILLDEESQRGMLDRFAGAVDAARAVEAAHAALEEARGAVTALIRRRDDASRRADYLRHVADQVEAARLREGEEAALNDEATRLTHAEELQNIAGGVSGALEDGDEGVVRRLGQLQRQLAALQRIDPATARLQPLYDAAFYAVEELAREVAAYAESVEHDPERLADVERRRDAIYRLLKKYGGTVAAVIATGREARAPHRAGATPAPAQATLEAAAREREAALAAAAARLTALRTGAAKRLSTEVGAQLAPLGMPDGRFSVRLVPREAIGPMGAEEVEYRVSLNVGHEERALARVASGGELARVMLALQTILAGLDHVPTLIFDEVDAGIGGAVGLMVADAMRRVAERHQVFAITHLAQIASRAAHHVAVRKASAGGVTAADVDVLDGDARVTELARMLGGDAASEVGRAHARELLASAGTPALAVMRGGVPRKRRA
jgi:DNA repair protein RecN (Recombination protein N)